MALTSINLNIFEQNKFLLGQNRAGELNCKKNTEVGTSRWCQVWDYNLNTINKRFNILAEKKANDNLERDSFGYNENIIY